MNKCKIRKKNEIFIIVLQLRSLKYFYVENFHSNRRMNVCYVDPASTTFKIVNKTKIIFR
jgi:prepilin-type processing-associated H-X9-DG protein